MKYIKLNLKSKSGFSNLFTADQIWGQMVWAISDLESDIEATNFVELFINDPPFLISNMFPQDYLPRVVLPPVKIGKDKKVPFQEERENRRKAKTNKKKNWIPIEVFMKYQNDIDQLKIAQIDNNNIKIKEINEIRSSINRVTGIPFKDGGLFNQTFLYSDNSFVIYLKILKDEEIWIKKINNIITYFNLVGLGGDRNIGKGNFEIKINDLNDIEYQIFNFKEGNVYTSLSRCSGQDLEPLYYKLDYYSGIIGGNLDESKAYNKYPILYFEPGSIFVKGKGSILKDVHTNNKICSYGYSFPLYLKK